MTSRDGFSGQNQPCWSLLCACFSICAAEAGTCMLVLISDNLQSLQPSPWSRNMQCPPPSQHCAISESSEQRARFWGCPASSGTVPSLPAGWLGGQPSSTVTKVTHIPGRDPRGSSGAGDWKAGSWALCGVALDEDTALPLGQRAGSASEKEPPSLSSSMDRIKCPLQARLLSPVSHPYLSWNLSWGHPAC